MKTNANTASSCLTVIQTVVLIVLLLLQSIQLSHADNRVVCPTDPSFYAYDSIDAINQDIIAEINDMTANMLGQSQPNYVYTLCPNTIFDGSYRLTPMLNASSFVCGQNGDSRDNCTIIGGNVQIYLIETSFTSIQYTSFHGLTLDSSTEFGVAAFGTNASTAEFFDCHWKVNNNMFLWFMMRR